MNGKTLGNFAKELMVGCRIGKVGDYRLLVMHGMEVAWNSAGK
jgi:hypothetical protein